MFEAKEVEFSVKDLLLWASRIQVDRVSAHNTSMLGASVAGARDVSGVCGCDSPHPHLVLEIDAAKFALNRMFKTLEVQIAGSLNSWACGISYDKLLKTPLVGSWADLGILQNWG